MEQINISNSISKISQIHSAVQDYLTEELASKGFENFSSSHGNILFQLNINKKMKMSELSQKINRDKSTTTVLVRKLIKMGLIKEENDENDKRNKYISLTQKGMEYNTVTSGLSKDLITKFYNNFTEEEKNLFCTLLEKIQTNFKSSN